MVHRSQADDVDADGSERTCIATRHKGDPSEMIRFVVGPDGTVYPDIRARLPGRGAWVDGNAESVQLAVKRKAFVRAFKRECTIDPDLPQRVEAMLEADALQSLAFASKAGQVVCGSGKVAEALTAGGVTALLHALDGRPDGIRKLEGAARSAAADGKKPSSVQIFSSQQLDLVLGRSNVIHAALLDGGASNAFLQRAARLERFRKGRSPQPEATLGDPAPSELDNRSG